MFETTRAIVLKSIKYKDKSYIIQCYTEEHGRLSFMLHHVHSKKHKSSYSSLLQPLSLINVTYNFKYNRELQTLKEIKCYQPYHEIPYKVIKSSIALFLSEILVNCLKEEERNESLYKFLEFSLLSLDANNKNISNFHLVFLFKLIKYLGFYPSNNHDDENKYFDLYKGEFRQNFNTSTCLNDEYSNLFNHLFNLSLTDSHNISLGSNKKSKLLEGILQYYSIHIFNIKNIKSLQVLTELFN